MSGKLIGKVNDNRHVTVGKSGDQPTAIPCIDTDAAHVALRKFPAQGSRRLSGARFVPAGDCHCDVAVAQPHAGDTLAGFSVSAQDQQPRLAVACHDIPALWDFA